MSSAEGVICTLCWKKPGEIVTGVGSGAGGGGEGDWWGVSEGGEGLRSEGGGGRMGRGRQAREGIGCVGGVDLLLPQ